MTVVVIGGDRNEGRSLALAAAVETLKSNGVKVIFSPKEAFIETKEEPYMPSLNEFLRDLFVRSAKAETPWHHTRNPADVYLGRSKTFKQNRRNQMKRNRK